MRTFQQQILVAAIAAVAIATPLAAQPVEIVATLENDRWQYPFNFTPGARGTGGLFAFDDSESSFQFNYLDGMAIVKFSVEVPEPLEASSLQVTSAKLTFWNPQTAAWNPANLDILLFPSGFNAPYAESTWAGTEPFVGGTNTTASPRNPFPRELGTDLPAEDNPVAVPWAIGTPVGYTGSAVTDAFPVEFELDVNNPTIQAELVAHLANGFSTWFLASNFAADETTTPPPGTVPYPEVIFSEGVSNSAFGTSQQAPRMVLEVQQASSVSNWSLYE